MRFFRKKETRVAYSNISASAFDKTVVELARKYGRDYCINIGAGAESNDLFKTLDINPDCKPDYVGDIRTLFAASSYHRDRAAEYPDLRRINPNQFMLVKMQHTAEHIEWIYQQGLFEWLFLIIGSGGALAVEVPNLEYIAKVYARNLERQLDGREPKYPWHEHNDLRQEETTDMQRWVNFKLYSGCSPGDYHHVCFDRLLLARLMKKAGFERISIWVGDTLKSLCFKPGSEAEHDLDSIIAQLTGV